MKTSRAVFLVFLTVSLCLVNIHSVKPQSSGTIYIRADGTVEGTDKIQRDGKIYTFTGDIGTDEWSYGINIEKDNIVVDGAGFLLKGHGQLTAIDIFALGKPIIHGINLDGRNNVTIKNLQIWGFNCGFWGNYCTKIKILDNNLTKIATNIILEYCSHNIISGNTMINNGTDGIYFYQGHNNTITKNYIKDNGNGIHAYQFSNSAISGNKITKSTNGIYLDDYSRHNLISGNTLTNNTHGIGINSCFNNTVSGNYITNNSHYSIWLAGQSSNNTITENNITNNAAGIYIREANNNKLSKNNFINNTQQVYDVGVVSPNYASPSVNNWDNGTTGNYWSDYNGTDNNRDGIGDTPHIIDENNQDNYPLMNPVTIPELPEDEKPTTLDPTHMLVVTVVAIVLAIIVSLAFYRRKKRHSINTKQLTISTDVSSKFY